MAFIGLEFFEGMIRFVAIKGKDHHEVSIDVNSDNNNLFNCSFAIDIFSFLFSIWNGTITVKKTGINIVLFSGFVFDVGIKVVSVRLNAVPPISKNF